MAELLEENKIFKPSVDKKRKILLPRNVSISVWKNSMGHVRNYTIGDVLARYKGLLGFNVLHQWDGMPLVCRQKMQLRIII